MYILILITTCNNLLYIHTSPLSSSIYQHIYIFPSFTAINVAHIGPLKIVPFPCVPPPKKNNKKHPQKILTLFLVLPKNTIFFLYTLFPEADDMIFMIFIRLCCFLIFCLCSPLIPWKTFPPPTPLILIACMLISKMCSIAFSERQTFHTFLAILGESKKGPFFCLFHYHSEMFPMSYTVYVSWIKRKDNAVLATFFWLKFCLILGYLTDIILRQHSIFQNKYRILTCVI